MKTISITQCNPLYKSLEIQKREIDRLLGMNNQVDKEVKWFDSIDKEQLEIEIKEDAEGLVALGEQTLGIDSDLERLSNEEK